tara:strand:+ start:546 stop:836 length:291 start_codon:yes stop_codon:yes gene_type:complete
MNVKLIRMWSGEDVVADLLEEKEDTIVLTNPIVAIPNGQGSLGFAPWSPLLKGRDVPLEMKKSYTVYITEVQEDVVKQYEQMFSLIQTPNNNLIVK